MIIKEMFVAGRNGRPDRHARRFQKLQTVPWRGVILYIARTAKYIDDVVEGAEVINWLETEALDAAGSAVESAYAVALAALQDYGYSEKKLRTEEAQMACGASAMDDNSKHALLHDNPMFASICAAMEEAEKSWGHVSEYEAAVSLRFKEIMDHGRGPVSAARRKAAAAAKDVVNPLNSIDPSIVCDGVKVVNDQSSDAFISMMEELKEFSQTGTNTKKKGHREKHLYGRSAPGFFAARPVRRNDYINNDTAMQAYWKEWKNLEKR